MSLTEMEPGGPGGPGAPGVPSDPLPEPEWVKGITWFSPLLEKRMASCVIIDLTVLCNCLYSGCKQKLGWPHLQPTRPQQALELLEPLGDQEVQPETA